MDFSEKLKELRLESKKSQQELADIFSIHQTTYSKYEKGLRQPDYQTLKKISDYFEISTDYLIGSSYDNIQMNITDNAVKLPIQVLGTASCGSGKDNNQNFYEDDCYIPKEWLRLSEDNYFLGYASGDSMINANIQDGSLLLFKKQSTLENNQIGLFHYNDCEYVKRFKRFDNGMIALLSDNPNYEPMFISEDEAFEVRGLVLREITIIEKE